MSCCFCSCALLLLFLHLAILAPCYFRSRTLLLSLSCPIAFILTPCCSCLAPLAFTPYCSTFVPYYSHLVVFTLAPYCSTLAPYYSHLVVFTLAPYCSFSSTSCPPPLLFHCLATHYCALLLYLVNWYSRPTFMWLRKNLDQQEQASSNNRRIFSPNLLSLFFFVLDFVCLLCFCW
jgi:hypothetical protein